MHNKIEHRNIVAYGGCKESINVFTTLSSHREGMYIGHKEASVALWHSVTEQVAGRFRGTASALYFGVMPEMFGHRQRLLSSGM
jgi:hypothetical protein